MKIGITIACTHSYLFALPEVLNRVDSALYHANQYREIEAVKIISTDANGVDKVKKICPEAIILETHLKEGGTRYKEQANLLIADLQGRGFQKCRELKVDFCWTVEADILVPHNALDIMLTMLEFDRGYYDVAFCTYPSQSGSMFLGGGGSYRSPINEDFTLEERKVPKERLEYFEKLKEDKEAKLKELEEAKEDEEKKEIVKALRNLDEELAEFNKEVKEKYAPKDNVFKLNGEKWRKRGWFDTTFPAIGKGAVLESDWTGLGCNLLTPRALALASFDGYDGKGTQDLFLNWKRWKPANLNFCVISHAVCEHVITDSEGKRQVAFAHHELEGECKGHLRIELKPFVGSDIG
ncbi:hypothetical protein P0Y35_11835 [Kiritimatiellaeota bacterium B1221]|nr:hypothetical protein [Kiritimatiellaeota bacterium B1221]